MGKLRGFALPGTALATTLDAVDRLTTASSGVWPWVELARRRNLDLDGFCRAQGIDLTRVRQPFARWSQRHCNSIADFVCGQLGTDAAMAAVLTVEAGHFQLLELLIRTAPTVADGLRLGSLFFPLLHDGGNVSYERSPDGVHAVTWVPPNSYPVHHGYVELMFGVTVLGIRRETRRWDAGALEVSLRRATPEDTSAYERALGCRPRFAAGTDRIAFDRDVASLSMARRNTEVHESARRVAHELIDGNEF